ncbi:MAG: helix-turn-helix transcriptional regulator [Gammaproteobacteria bacterium]|nr:helix-turn-helix transcriptional regulator [Gammaproteobacteria bacterium]
MQSFLLVERNRLEISQKKVFDEVGVNKATYYRWEQGNPIPSSKLALLAKLGFDVQFVVTGIRSLNAKETTKALQNERPYFDFEGKLSVIVHVLEDLLNEQNLELPAASKGIVIEALLMEALLKKEIPTKENIIPMLKVAGF